MLDFAITCSKSLISRQYLFYSQTCKVGRSSLQHWLPVSESGEIRLQSINLLMCTFCAPLWEPNLVSVCVTGVWAGSVKWYGCSQKKWETCWVWGFRFQSFIMFRLTHADRLSWHTRMVRAVAYVIRTQGVATHCSEPFTHLRSNLPEEVKVDGGVFGLDECPETPKEVRSLERNK